MVKLILDKYLDNHKITRYSLAKDSGIQYHIITKYYKNQVLRYDSDILDRICKTLECDISDIIEYKPDKK